MHSGASTRSSAAVPRRLVELTTSFANDWQAVFRNTQARRAVQRLIRRLQNADVLPLEGDPLSFVPSADTTPIARFAIHGGCHVITFGCGIANAAADFNCSRCRASHPRESK
jgi:hypothetical protein